MAYKLVEFDGTPRIKLSSSKVLYPGRKQLFRSEHDERFSHDLLAPFGSEQEGTPLLQQVMRGGHIVEANVPSLEESREYTRRQFTRLPDSLRQLRKSEPPYRVEVAEELTQLLERMQEDHRSSHQM